MTEKPKRFVFVHVPRTGGSNYWSSLVAAAAAQDKSIASFDMYATGLLRHHTSGRQVMLARRLVEEAEAHSGPLLIHYHDSFGIFRALRPLQAQYVTLLRDPVDRYVSSLRFISMYVTAELGNRARGHDFDFLMGEAPRIARQVDEKTAPVERALSRLYWKKPALLSTLLRTPALQNYYMRFFYNYFVAEREEQAIFDYYPRPAGPFLNGEGAVLMAAVMKQHFAHIGFTEHMAASFAWSEQQLGLRITNPQVNPNSSGQRLRFGVLVRLLLAPFFRVDYELLQALRRL